MPSLRYTRARCVSTVRVDRCRRSAISRLLRPPAASRATSRSRAVSGSTPPPRASGGVRSPPARVGQLGRSLHRRGGPAPVAALLVQLGQLGGGLGGVARGRRAARSRRPRRSATTSALGDGHGVAAVGVHERTVDDVDERTAAARPPPLPLPKRTRSLSSRRLERAHPVALDDLDDVTKTGACGDQVAAAGVEPGPCALARGERRRHRAVADGVGARQRLVRRTALAEEEVTLGDADVRPDQGGVLAGGGRRAGRRR